MEHWCRHSYIRSCWQTGAAWQNMRPLRWVVSTAQRRLHVNGLSRQFSAFLCLQVASLTSLPFILLDLIENAGRTTRTSDLSLASLSSTSTTGVQSADCCNEVADSELCSMCRLHRCRRRCRRHHHHHRVAAHLHPLLLSLCSLSVPCVAASSYGWRS